MTQFSSSTDLISAYALSIQIAPISWSVEGCKMHNAGFPGAEIRQGKSQGLQKERPNLRVVAKRMFRTVETIEELYKTLFGA